MSDKPRSLYLHDLSWPELKEMLPDIKMAIIPVGSTEQHGPNGSFEMDTAGSREFSKKLAESLYPNVLVTPPVAFGISGHHIHFPGTITLRQNTMVDLLMDIAWSLKQHGITRIFMANGHGGNIPVLGVAGARMRMEMGLKVAWATVPYDIARDVILPYVKSPTWGHSCEIECSVMLHLYPQAIKKDALAPGKVCAQELERRAMGVSVSQALYFDEETENGCLGDARLATAETGEHIVRVGVERLSTFLQKWMQE